MAREDRLDDSRSFAGNLDSRERVRQSILSARDEADGRSSLEEIADLMGIRHLLDRATALLSTGEMRRVLIARAMVKSPRLLILDEPCEGLDGDHRGKVLQLVNEIGSKTRTQILYVTHYPDEIPPCVTNTLRPEKRSQGV